MESAASAVVTSAPRAARPTTSRIMSPPFQVPSAKRHQAVRLKHRLVILYTCTMNSLATIMRVLGPVMALMLMVGSPAASEPLGGAVLGNHAARPCGLS